MWVAFCEVDAAPSPKSHAKRSGGVPPVALPLRNTASGAEGTGPLKPKKMGLTFAWATKGVPTADASGEGADIEDAPRVAVPATRRTVTVTKTSHQRSTLQNAWPVT